MIRERYRQACRSVVIRTHNPESTVRALSSFGPLKFAQCVSNDKVISFNSQFNVGESNDKISQINQQNNLFIFL